MESNIYSVHIFAKKLFDKIGIIIAKTSKNRTQVIGRNVDGHFVEYNKVKVPNSFGVLKKKTTASRFWPFGNKKEW